jgi:hypothetical protein
MKVDSTIEDFFLHRWYRRLDFLDDGFNSNLDSEVETICFKAFWDLLRRGSMLHRKISGPYYNFVAKGTKWSFYFGDVYERLWITCKICETETKVTILNLLVVISVYSGYCLKCFLNLKSQGFACTERSGIKIYTTDVTLRKSNKFMVLLLVDKQTKKNQYGRSLGLPFA